MLRALNPQGSLHKPPEKLISLDTLWLENRLGPCNTCMGSGYSFMLLLFTRDSHIHCLGRKHTEVQVMQVFLCLWCSLIRVVCSVLILSPDTMFLRGRPGHDYSERAQHFSGVEFYFPFGLIDKPLALDEMQRWDFDLAAGRPSPVKPDLLCPEFIPQGRSESGAEGLGRIVTPSATLMPVFVTGVAINGSAAVRRSICEETSHSTQCSRTPPATQDCSRDCAHAELHCSFPGC